MKLRQLIATGHGRRPLARAPCWRPAAQINGAGATFPNPIYSKWFSEYTSAPGREDQLPVDRLGRRHQPDLASRPCSSAPPTAR